MLKTVIKSQLGTLGKEPVIVGGETVDAVLAETERSENIMGGTREERRLTASYPTDPTITVRSGQKITARGQKWKIESVSEGAAMTHLTLTEPNRARD